MAQARDESRKTSQSESSSGDDPLLSSPELGFNGDYESVRANRIKENQDRAQQLGLIINPSLPFKRSTRSNRPPHLRRKPKSSGHRRRPKFTATTCNVVDDRKALKTLRRSLRLQKLAVESDEQENVATTKKVEFYTEEDVNLLGRCEEPWMISSTYNKYGKKILNQEQGKACHQCRQKTLGHHTNCSNCKAPKGQLCGHCLYTRYGENVLEAKRNSNWICPVCRGICNCSYCRTKKGWAPIGRIYDRVMELGYKSVAHYLILTLQKQPYSEDP